MNLMTGSVDVNNVSRAGSGVAEGFIDLASVIRNGVCNVEQIKLEQVREFLDSIYEELQESGFEFAYRTVKEIRQYYAAAYELQKGNFNLITLNDNAHVAINLTDGAKSSGTGASNTTTVKSNAKVDVAHGFNKSLAGTYKVTASGLNLRAGAGTGKSILAVMKNGEKVQCYGYYNDCNGVKWLYVVYKNIVGYASSKYLSK